MRIVPTDPPPEGAAIRPSTVEQRRSSSASRRRLRHCSILHRLPNFLDGRYKQADQTRDDRDDDEPRRTVFDKVAGAMHDGRPIAELDGVAPREMHAGCAAAVLV